MGSCLFLGKKYNTTKLGIYRVGDLVASVFDAVFLGYYQTI
jgi:hypothetical protein